MAVRRTLLIAAVVACLAGPTSLAQPSQDATRPLYELLDPEGDRSIWISPLTTVPVDAVAPIGLDITAVRVLQETDQIIKFEIGTVSLNAPEQSVVVGLEFGVSGTDMRWAGAWVFSGFNVFNEIWLPPPTELDVMGGYLCILPPDSPPLHGARAPPAGCNRQASWAGADYSRDSILVVVPKLALVGRASIGPLQADSVPPALTPAASIHTIQASATLGSWSFGASVFDEAPEAGVDSGAYVMTHPVAGSMVSISSPAGSNQAFTYAEADGEGVPTGFAMVLKGTVAIRDPTPVALHITNNAPASRRYSVATNDGGGTKGWSIGSIPPITVAAGDTRLLLVEVAAPRGVEHGDSAVLTIGVGSDQHPDESARVQLRVTASETLSSQAPRLYFHAPTTSTRGSLNPMKLDPRADDQNNRILPGSAGGDEFQHSFTFTVQQDLAMPDRVALDAQRPANLIVHLESNQERAYFVTARVEAISPSNDCFSASCAEWIILASSTKPVTVRVAPTRVEWEMAIDPAAAAEQAGGPGFFRVVIVLTDQEPIISIMHGVFLGRPEIDPQGSWLQLPVDDAEDSGPRALVAIVPITETERFVNPGETVQFPVRLINQGSTAVSVALDAQPPPGGWSFDVSPAGPFRVPAGSALRTTVLVHAPADAPESDTVLLTLAARSLDTGKTLAWLDLRAVATSGVDLADDPDAPEPDAETQASLLEAPAESSPATPLAGLVSAAIAAMWAVRRRSLQQGSVDRDR